MSVLFSFKGYLCFFINNFAFSCRVRELSQELLRLLAQRASSGPAGTVPFLQSQEDFTKLRKLLELQVDR